jgi:chaperonin GroES
MVSCSLFATRHSPRDRRGLTVPQPALMSPAAYWHSADKTANTLRTNDFLSNANAALRAATRENMAKLKFRPLHDRVVVKRIDAEAKTKGGIIIPDTAKEKPQEGEIVAVGPGGRDENGKLTPMGVKAGDRVLFGKWSGTEVKLDGDELLIMKESDIMGVIA